MNDLNPTFPALPGAYLLVLEAAQATTIQVGRLGAMQVTPGCYLYAGSALGAGGLRGRLRHHLHVAARPHWHVDYLRAVTELVAVWWLVSPERFEHRWALALAQAPGCYLYVGSALGAGGLAGRLRHHLRVTAQPHWHIDALRAVTELTAVWWLATAERLEHRWAQALAQASSCSLPMPRFGASDCRCPAHLLYLPTLPAAAILSELLSLSPSAPPTLGCVSSLRRTVP